MKQSKELKAKIKKLKRRKKVWMKYQRGLKKIFKQERYWLNWLLESKMPYLRSQHAAYKRNLRTLAKYPESMGDTYGRIIFTEEGIERLDRKIMDLVIGEACDNA